MGIGGGHGAAPAGLNQSRGFGPSGSHQSDSWPRCERHHSHSNIVSHTAWEIHTRQDTCFGNVLHSCVLYSVSDGELLNGLVLGHASGAAGAANRLYTAPALFGTIIVPSFFDHLESEEPKEVLSFLIVKILPILRQTLSNISYKCKLL